MYQYYDLNVTLLGIEPPIWRRFLLPDSVTFYDLHKAIQAAANWQDYHLFEFTTSPDFSAPLIAGISDIAESEVPPSKDAKSVKLKSFFKGQPDTSCIYHYDFGDSWHVLVKLNGLQSLPYKFKRTLLNGGRAFPLEDSGGIGGYEECVEVLNLSMKELEKDPDAQDRLTWMGAWKPEKFDLDATKRKFDR